MNLLLLLPLAIPFGCLALLSLLAFLGVLAVAGALQVVGVIRAGLDMARRHPRRRLALRSAHGTCAEGDDPPCKRGKQIPGTASYRSAMVCACNGANGPAVSSRMRCP